MVTLKTVESVKEQLALGGKLTSLRRRFIVDLATKQKEEIVEATVDKLLLPDLDREAPYQAEAEEWIEKYLPDYTTIVVKGRGGAVARVPYREKDTMLPRILELFNS